MEQSLERMLEKAMTALSREINNLTIASVTRKLSPTESRDLVNYVKLLTDIDREGRKRAEDMSPEELNAALSRSIGTSTSGETGGSGTPASA